MQKASKFIFISILVTTGFLKFYSALFGKIRSDEYDPVLFVPMLLFLSLGAALEFLVVALILISNNVKRQIDVVLFTVSIFSIYRLIILVGNFPQDCACLGTVWGWWPWLENNQNLASLALYATLVISGTIFIVYSQNATERDLALSPVRRFASRFKFESKILQGLVLVFLVYGTILVSLEKAKTLTLADQVVPFESLDKISSNGGKNLEFVYSLNEVESIVIKYEGEDETNKLADLSAKTLGRFFSAYSSGDFDDFWSFRVIENNYEPSEGANVVLMNYFNNLVARHTDVEKAEYYESMMNMDTPLDLMMRNVWNLAVEARKFNFDGLNQGESFLGLCTNCVTGIAANTAIVTDADKEDVSQSAMMKAVGASARFGSSVYPSLLQATTSEGSLEFKKYYILKFDIALKNGYFHRIYMALGFDTAIGELSPIRIATSTGSYNRAYLFF